MASGMSARQIIFRSLGLLLGLVWIATGSTLLVANAEQGWYRGIVVPIGFIVSGMYLLMFGATGRPRFGMKYGARKVASDE